MTEGTFALGTMTSQVKFRGDIFRDFGFSVCKLS